MTSSLKVLGLAVAAVLAMSVTWAVSAQAADPELHCTSTTNTCTVTGSEINTHTFNVEGANFRCRSELSATLNAKTVSSVSGVRATYSACRLFGGGTWNMGACTYTFNMVEGSSPATANFSISCPEGGSMTFNQLAIGCTITIPAQNNRGHVVFKNGGGAEPTDVAAQITASGITYTLSGANCVLGRGTRNNGSYNGESTLEGFNDPFPTEGNKVGLHVKPL